MLNFQGFYLSEEEPLMATLGEIRALGFRKYVAEQGMNFPKPSKKHNLRLSYSILITNGFSLSKEPSKTKTKVEMIVKMKQTIKNCINPLMLGGYIY